jgi:hypothetical protein
VDYLAEANDNGAGASHGSTSTGNKRSREESGADEPMVCSRWLRLFACSFTDADRELCSFFFDSLRTRI